MQQLELTPRWRGHFMRMAQLVSEMSKDPSTKVGAVIVRPDRTVAATGYNGYPRACKDDDYTNRERKYQRIIHGEMNAILTARERLDGYTLFTWPLPPCERCMPHIIQSGITRMFVPRITGDRWRGSCLAAQMMAVEAGLTVIELYDSEFQDEG